MIPLLSTYIPMDRRRAMSRGEALPDRQEGATLFADISGFTSLTAAFMATLGPRRGPEELTRQLNRVYHALIHQVHRYGGSVLGFSGDAITCWLDETIPAPGQALSPASLRATACGLAMQAVMADQFQAIQTPDGQAISLGLKVAISAGPVRRFRVGSPAVQHIDIIAGKTVDRMAEAEQWAEKGEVIVAREIIGHLGDRVEIATWRGQPYLTDHFAVVRKLKGLSADPLPSFSVPEILQFFPEEGLSKADVRPWLLPPVYERIESGQEQFLSEIRPAVPLFLRFKGLAYDSDEAAGKRLDTFIRQVQQILAVHGGYLIQVTIGDKGSYLYAAFGAPLTHDDDPIRAVTAALAMQALSKTLPYIKNLQIGISQGRMRTGAYGGLTRRTYGVLGNEVNTAARLMDVAKPGQIIISQRIAEAVGKHYRLDYLRPVQVKGKREPIPICAVKNPRLPSPQRPATLFINPLVGRQAELAKLEQYLDLSLTGQGQVVQLEGVAGVGKSHLTAEFVEQATRREIRVALGVSQSTARNAPYYAWQQILRTLFALTEPSKAIHEAERNQWAEQQIAQIKALVELANPDWLIRLPLLGDLLKLPIKDNKTTATFAPKLRQEALQALVVALVQHWAKQQSLLLVLEDAYWQDEASTGLTLALARAIGKVPVLLLLVQRPEETSSDQPELARLSYYHHLTLNELPADSIKALITQHLSGEVSPLVSSFIQVRTQGNPFFSEELLDTLQETGQLERDAQQVWHLSETMVAALRQGGCLTDQGGRLTLRSNAPLEAVDLGLPDTVHGTVLARIDRLPERYKLTLKIASVIGRTFDLNLLLNIFPEPPKPQHLQEQIKEMEARDLVRLEAASPHPIYMFKHNITQEVAYNTLLDRQRRQLHQAVAEALEARTPDAIERLAYHYYRTDVRDKALHYLDQAAGKTQQEYANETALTFCGQALGLEERWSWRKGQVEILHLLGRREAEVESLRVLETNPEAPAFDIAFLWGQYYEAIGEYEPAQTAVERALAESRALDDLAGEVNCLAQLGLIAYRQGDYEKAKAWYSQALALFQSEKTYPNKIIRAFTETFKGLGTIHEQQGNFSQAQTYYEQGLTLSRISNDKQGEANILIGLGGMTFYQRNFAKARSYYQRALKIQQIIGDRTSEGINLYRQGQIECDEGDYGRVQEYLSAALSILEATGNRWEMIGIWNTLGIVYQELGLLSKAQSCLNQALQLVEEIGAGVAKASFPLVNLGLVMRDQGDLTSAEKLLTKGITQMQALDNKRQMSFFLSYLSTVNLEAGETEKAIEQAQEAIRLWETLGLHLRTADDLATLAAAYLATGNLKKALTYAEQTFTILEQCGGEGPEFPQRDFFICYQVFMLSDQQQRARVALKSAYELVMLRAEKILEPILRQSFLKEVEINQKIVEEYNKW